MSVIWSGVTEEGAVVPVQVTAEGKVVAVGDGPEGDYLKLTGGNLTGDLTVNQQITLTTNGSASFAGDVTVGGGGVLPATPNISLNADGSADFAGAVVVSDGTSLGCVLNKAGVMTLERARSGSSGGLYTFLQQATINNTLQSSLLTLKAFEGSMRYAIDSSGNQFIGTSLETAPPNITLNADGSATFAGDVVIGSRGEKWLIRESNGVAMLVQQTLQQRMEKVRDLPNELDLIEAALNEVMDRLRMTPPAGWPVWDGQSEATTGNDNA